MKHRRDPATPSRVREPVQVYLDAADLERLERLRRQLEASKSDVLRRGLEALERELLDPERHPALRIIGIVGRGTVPPREGPDPAREHDRVLADAE
ncbi:MAG: ribbon-helix-helix protein, CopG family, partial [Gemmatimonadetes bacterium]|nr:ribbon-helix-helix protein, CopG family [Gemmatimonadota bacterium]